MARRIGGWTRGPAGYTVSSRGFVLIEVLVALAILGFAGLALVEVASQSLVTLDRAREVEHRLADEDRLLAAHALLDRRDLGVRVGWRRVGPYDVRVDRLGFSLFRVSVGPADGAPDLITVVYRPAAGSEGGDEE
jgi:prepilin-type N-terminal cleavage/methylation domain-containing protein